MITVEYCQTMARYNAWQNKWLMEGVRQLDMTELLKDRGAFFGSIFATCNHLLWGDQIWISRFDGGHRPKGGIKESVDLHDDLQLMLDDRLRTDQRIERWAAKVKQIDLIGPLTWYSGGAKANVTRPKAICVTHFFNHQTHHRGQIHAMLTSAGVTPHATDLLLMSEEG